MTQIVLNLFPGCNVPESRESHSISTSLHTSPVRACFKFVDTVLLFCALFVIPAYDTILACFCMLPYFNTALNLKG